MRNVKITKEDALNISHRDEGHFFDRKSLAISGQKLQKIGVAFANADGGEVVVGIKDDREEPDPQLRWCGANKEEDFNGHLQALFEVQPTLNLTNEVLFCEGKPGYVLRVNVDKSPQVHKTPGNKVYQRYGAQSLPLDPQQIIDLSFAKGSSSFEDQMITCLRPEALVDSAELRKFLGGYSPKTDPLEFLVNQHLLENASWNPVCAGVLLFSDNPSASMPLKCAVKIARYETKEDAPERDHLSKQLTFEGPLYPLIHDTIGAITEIMSSVNIWTPEGLKKAEYPPETIWEILVNAIIHRDYSISDDVQVFIYNNRIEVLSPGKLPGYVNVDNILDARYSRNPKIVRTLNRYKNPPNKDLGEGLNTAFQKMTEWKLKNPVISEEQNYVKVIISHTSLAAPEDAIMNFLKNQGAIKNSQARDITGIKSENAVKQVFYKLRDNQLIERVPGLGGSASQWRLMKKENKL